LRTCWRGVLGGLGSLHGMRCLLRDVESGNVMSRARGAVKIGDLCFWAELLKERGKRSSVVCTPYCMLAHLFLFCGAVGAA